MIINLALLFVIGVGLWFGVIVEYINAVAKSSLAHKEEVAVKSVINYYQDLVKLKKNACLERKQCEAILQTKPADSGYSCDDLTQCNDYTVPISPSELSGVIKDMSGVSVVSTGVNSIFVGRHSKFVIADQESILYDGFYYSTKSYNQCVAALNNMVSFTNIGISNRLVGSHIAPGTKGSMTYIGYPTSGHSTPEGVCLGVSPDANEGYIWIRAIEE